MKDKNLVFTFWQNDLVILNLWVKYYSKYFDKLYVYCFNTKEEKWSDLLKLKAKFPKVDFEKLESYNGDRIDGDPRVAVGFIRNRQDAFLKEHKWVLFANCDEYLLAKNLKSLLKNPSLIVIPCEGFDIVQDENEKRLRYNRNILTQRKYWVKNPNYNKIILSRIPLSWNQGLHQPDYIGTEESKQIRNTGLYLVHLKHADLKRKGDFGPKISVVDKRIIEGKRKGVPRWMKKLL